MLPKGIRLEVKKVFESHIPQGTSRDLWRAIIHINSDIPDKNRLIKIYEVWATVEYLEDHARKANNNEEMRDFALEFIEKRFKENENEVPPESGAFCALGKCKLGNSDEFPAKLT